MTVVLAGFGLVGPLLPYSALHQMIASLVAETIVEAESRVVRRRRIPARSHHPAWTGSLYAPCRRSWSARRSRHSGKGPRGKVTNSYDRFVEIGDTHVVRGRPSSVRPRCESPQGPAHRGRRSDRDEVVDRSSGAGSASSQASCTSMRSWSFLTAVAVANESPETEGEGPDFPVGRHRGAGGSVARLPYKGVMPGWSVPRRKPTTMMIKTVAGDRNESVIAFV